MPRPVTCKGSLVNIVFRLTFVERRYTVRHKNVYRSQPASRIRDSKHAKVPNNNNNNNNILLYQKTFARYTNIQNM